MRLSQWKKLAAAMLAGLSLSSTAASVMADEPIPYIPAEPATQFTAGVDFLIYTRDVDLQSPSNAIAGPDAGLLRFDSADFERQAGFRAFLSMKADGLRVDAVYSEIGEWDHYRIGRLTSGVSFDDGIGSEWTGANSVNLSTLFPSLHRAATGALGGDADEFEGLSPSASFNADTAPLYELLYESEMATFELNAFTIDDESPYRWGLGYRNLELDEVAGVTITGTFRAVDIAAPNGGLSHASLTGPGGMTLLGGVANGFEDETSNPSFASDILAISNNARTSNRMNGIQALLERRVMYWGGWTIDGVLKAGAFHNQARGIIDEVYVGTDPVSGENSVYGRTLTDSEDCLSFIGSVGFNSYIPLSEHWSFTSGYEGMFLTDVALAPDQNAGVTGGVYNVNSNGHVIIHGGRLGLQFAY